MREVSTFITAGKSTPRDSGRARGISIFDEFRTRARARLFARAMRVAREDG